MTELRDPHPTIRRHRSGAVWCEDCKGPYVTCAPLHNQYTSQDAYAIVSAAGATGWQWRGGWQDCKQCLATDHRTMPLQGYPLYGKLDCDSCLRLTRRVTTGYDHS